MHLVDTFPDPVTGSPYRKERVMTRSPLLAVTLVLILGVLLALVPMLIELFHVLGGALDGIVPQS